MGSLFYKGQGAIEKEKRGKQKGANETEERKRQNVRDHNLGLSVKFSITKLMYLLISDSTLMLNVALSAILE